MKIEKKNLLKYLGNIVTVLAIIFVFKQLFSNGLDYHSIFKSKNILPVVIIVIVQAIIVATNTYPWKKIVEILSNKKLPYKETVTIYVKSNLMKYVPGNVFQYVGRNELAMNQNISHLKVATATIIDVAMTVLSAMAISLVFLYDYIWKFMSTFTNIWFLLILFIFFVLVLYVLIVIFKKNILQFLSNNQDIFKKKNIHVLIKCFFYYVFVMLISSLMYMLVFTFILDQHVTTTLFFKLFSAYTLSWLVGFITPGAPAGIGIKEAVMVGVTGGLVNQSTIALSMIVLRVLATFSDVLAFLIVILLSSKKKQVAK
ncbi:hypothetical protein [Enterococcus camelliae]|uniref:Lysyltransferase n=1 Tax=Enterococcus camelliae TaxID=453959 RepID=A0ABW5TJM8_9ENTE